MDEQTCFSSTDSVSVGFHNVEHLQRDSLENMLFLLTLKLKWTSKSVSRVQIPLVMVFKRLGVHTEISMKICCFC